MSYMPPIMGQMLAGKVIRRLVGLERRHWPRGSAALRTKISLPPSRDHAP